MILISERAIMADGLIKNVLQMFLSTIADCVNHFVSKSSNSEFTTKDIWLYPYSTESIEFLFKKPNVQSQLVLDFKSSSPPYYE